MKINNFRGDLTDTSAKKEPLVVTLLEFTLTRMTTVVNNGTCLCMIAFRLITLQTPLKLMTLLFYCDTSQVAVSQRDGCL